MKFKRILFENIFAYEGEVSFDLSATTDARNIVLVWGRNGMGKTSFLNAVRLLFTGVDNVEFRTVGFPPMALSIRSYILGDNATWTGVLNRGARRRKVSLGEILDSRVQITWTDADGAEITAARWWTLDADDLTNGVYVDRNAERIAGAVAEKFLAETLPPNLVKFFFFDGEDIKSLAESSGSLQTDFDKLLQITFVEELARELEGLASERRRKNLQSDLRVQVDVAQAALAKAVTAQLSTEEQLADLDAQLNSDGIELRRLQLRKTNLSSGASEVQRAALQMQKNKVSKQLEEITDAIVRTVPVAIPLLANMRMLKQVAAQAEARLASGSSAEYSFVRAVNAQIPRWIEEAEPDLDPNAIERIAEHVAARFEESLTQVQPSGLFASTDLLIIERLRRGLDQWLAVGVDRRETQARDLSEAHRLKTELHDVSEALLHIEVGSQANVEQYRTVVNRIEELEVAVAKFNQKKGVLAAELTALKRSQTELKAKVEQLISSQNQASQEGQRARFLTKVATALNNISEALKKASRHELEVMLNDRFKRIIDHPLVDRIGIDDTYVMTYYERSGRTLGRTSLSSGMKQLVATALLWAMKDSAGADIPVIIDTPLGRIDRENQDHLLLSYYPAIARQVIILPTNAELDSRKRALLEPHVSRHYTIVNDTGDAARIEDRALVDLP